MISLTIRGVVLEAETDLPVVALYIKAYDEDLAFDDLLGGSVTDEQGRFQIITERSDFRELFEKRPDLYFKVLSPDGRTFLKRTTTTWNWKSKPDEEVVIRIPRKDLGSCASKQWFGAIGGSDGAPRESLDPGEPLVVEATGLRPATVHQVIVREEGGEELFLDQVMADALGRIEPTVIWPQFGLDDLQSGKSMTVEEARKKWSGRAVILELRAGSTTLGQTRITAPTTFRRPLALSTDQNGALVNGFEVGRRDAIVSLYSLPPARGDGVRFYLVPRQHDWRIGDPIRPVRLKGGRAAVQDVPLQPGQQDARLTLAKADELPAGAYDFILRPLRYGYEHDHLTLGPDDIVGSHRVTGLVVRERFMASKAVRGGCVNALEIAGRSISGAPYLQFTNVFQVGENIYGALDPAALDPELLSKMVALYVVQHKTAAQWSADSSLQHLPVLGGNPAVQKFLTQSYCVNANKRLLWGNASQEGQYDVVADFGNNTPNAGAFASDASYDTPLDIVDGYFLPGFRIVPDPAVDTQFANVGSFSYDETTQGTITVTNDFGGTVTVNRRAVVYFPADFAGATTAGQISAGAHPMVVIAHGNSSFTNSYQGYNYLLEHLARNGFIAASIHLNPGMYALDRARVLLSHIGILKGLFGPSAANNIGIMGHSRGGEAVVTAARLNQQEALGHGINAVISLAPTDWISSPTLGGAWATPYLVVYGSMDGDVSGVDNTGFELYDRATGQVKSMVFVYGSTHGRYNTVWGDVDVAWLGATDIPKLINADAHQKIAQGYMTAFFRQHLRGETQWEGIFKGEWIPAAVQQADAGKAKLYVQYEDTLRVQVDNFEGAHTMTSWQTSTVGGAVIQTGLPGTPQEAQLATVDSHSPHETGGVLLSWNNIGDALRFDVPAAQKNVQAYAALSFRVTQRFGSASNPADQAQDLRVTLKDLGGKSRAVRVSKFGEIPPPHARHYASLTKSALTTIRIPLTAYTIKCAGVQEVDLANIESLTFEFSEKATGEVEIDSVEFTR